MTTLRELLDDMPCLCAEDLARIESWAYGGEKEVPQYESSGRWAGYENSPGKTREPGLVERVMGYSRDDVYDRLKQELGDPRA